MSLTKLKFFGVTAAMLAMLAVAMGAFAAHGLKSILEPAAIQTIKTAVLYQFIHSLAILILVCLAMSHTFKHLGSLIATSASLMLIGCVLFSGSLYGLVLTQMSWLGPVTPIGGVAFITGWLFLIVAFIRINSDIGNALENNND